MYLSIDEMKNNDTISTLIRIDKTMTIRALRIGLYKHATPDGTLSLAIKDGGTTIASQSLLMSDLDATVGSYFHGLVKYELDGLRINLESTEAYKELTLEFTLTGHTDDSDNYIALIKQPQADQFVDKFGTIAYEDGQSAEQLEHFQPFMIELYALK